MKLALSTQKRGGETEKKIKQVILAVRCIQGLVILVVLASLALGLITIMRFFSVIMALVLGTFFHFGGNMLAKILMPKEDPTIEVAVWEKRAEPAKKILQAGEESVSEAQSTELRGCCACLTVAERTVPA